MDKQSLILVQKNRDGRFKVQKRTHTEGIVTAIPAKNAAGTDIANATRVVVTRSGCRSNKPPPIRIVGLQTENLMILRILRRGQKTNLISASSIVIQTIKRSEVSIHRKNVLFSDDSRNLLEILIIEHPTNRRYIPI